MATATKPKAPAAESAVVPKTWPGAFGLYKYSKAAVRPNLWPLVALYLIALLVGGVIGSLGGSESGTSSYAIAQILSFIFSTYASVAMTIAMLRTVARKEVDVADSFRSANPFFFNYLVMTILTGIIAVVSFVALIIPFFIIMPRLLLAEFFLVDKNLGPTEAIKASWEATRGHAGKIWGIIGANVAMALLMLTIIGIPFSIYFLVMYAAALPLLYRWLVDSGKVAGPALPKSAKRQGPALPKA